MHRLVYKFGSAANWLKPRHAGGVGVWGVPALSDGLRAGQCRGGGLTLNPLSLRFYRRIRVRRLEQFTLPEIGHPPPHPLGPVG